MGGDLFCFPLGDYGTSCLNSINYVKLRLNFVKEAGGKEVTFVLLNDMFMKKIILMVIMMTTLTGLQTFARSSNNSPLASLLSSYFDIKNALVNSDGAVAAARAKELLTAIDAVDVKTLTAADAQGFTPLKDKLTTAARGIAGAKDIAAQRASFAKLSADFYTLGKNVKISGQPVYYTYCPMTKNYWLSSDKEIKNPYFGNQMLTCGTVKETLI